MRSFQLLVHSLKLYKCLASVARDRRGILVAVLCLFLAPTLLQPAICDAQSMEQEFDRILHSMAARLSDMSTVRLEVQAKFSREGSATAKSTAYTVTAERDDKLYTGCQFHGVTTDGEVIMFDGEKLLEGMPASGRMHSYAAARQPQSRIGGVLTGWDLLPLPGRKNILPTGLDEKDITDRAVKAGMMGTTPVVILSCKLVKAGGIIQEFIEWHIRESDMLPLRIVRLSNWKPLGKTYAEVDISSFEVDPPLDRNAFTGSTLPANIEITEAPRPGYDGPKLLEAGKKAPEFTATGTDGRKYRLSDLRDKVVLLDFFFTDCFPCRRVIPSLIELRNSFAADELVILALDPIDDVRDDALRSMVDSSGINYPVTVVPHAVAVQYGVRAYPVSFIIGRDGTIISAHGGFDEGIEPAAWRESILSALAD